MALSVCRSCLDSSSDIIDLQQTNHKENFFNLVGIQVDKYDGLPQHICTKCAHKFTFFCTFREQVLKNHHILLESLEKNKFQKTKEIQLIKTETIIVKDSHIEADMKEEPLDDTEGIIYADENIQFEEQDTKCTLQLDAKKKKDKDKIKRKRQTKAAKAITPRTVIEVDPEKITTIRLTEEEQKERHKTESWSSAFMAMPHRCLMCYKGFNYERKLQAHVEKYHKEGAKFVCNICHRTLLNSASLALHKSRHDTLYQCRLCLSSFVEKKQALSHYESAHEGIEKVVTCKICGMDFRHRSTLNGHMRSRHPDQERPTCDVCGKSFVTKDSLLDHLLIHSGEKQHMCSCGKRFRLKSELATHARSHLTARPFTCLPCDKSFKTRASYNNHMRLSRPHVDHSLLREHRCSKCDRGFAAKWQLRAHVAQHGGARHPCSDCEAVLSTRAALRKHIRSTHLRIAPPRNHVCHTCGKRFAGGLMLENHLRTHTGEKPFVCSFDRCESRFSQKSTLRTHVRLVHLNTRRRGTADGAG